MDDTSETVTRYLSQWALTRGIIKIEGTFETDPERPEDPIPAFRLKGGRGWCRGEHAHVTRVGAILAARALRLSRVATLRREIAHLEALTFPMED